MIKVLGSLQPRDKFTLHRHLLVKYRDKDKITEKVLDFQIKRTGFEGQCFSTLTS